MKFRIKFDKHLISTKKDSNSLFMFTLNSGISYIRTKNNSWFFELQILGLAFIMAKDIV